MTAFRPILPLAALLLAAPAPALDLQEGLWEVTATTEAEGLPMKMQPVTTRECLTEAQAIPQPQQDGNADCQPQNVRTEGDTVSWEMECAMQGGEASAEGAITYRGDTLTGGWRMQARAQGMTMVMNTRIEGRRVGPCP
ncbi:MAG: DUF3617 family protein [Candidatus Competibacterales bacterium]|nr:DUF3617 family protein [Candidatus Competibacterales bacterium]